MSNMAQPFGDTDVSSPGDHSQGGIRGFDSGDNMAEAVVDAGICECPYCNRQFKIGKSAPTSGSRYPFDCKRCGFHWNSKSGDPTKCPKCGSYAWDKPTVKCTCNACKYAWISRKTSGPTRCPKCGSYAWDKPSLDCVCMVCNYSWVSRKPGGPSKCPNCKSNRWDEAPMTKNTKVQEKDAAEVSRKWVLEKYAAGLGCIDISTQLGLPLLTVMSFIKEDSNSPVFPRL